jgi:DNA-binding XRE family transcriptional regulator
MKNAPRPQDTLYGYRAALFPSQGQMARAMGMSCQHWSKIETGRIRCHPKHWARLAKVLHLPLRVIAQLLA